MPGTTRYSATFDRTYEEDDRLGLAPPANARRSRSQSLQTLTGLDGRPYTPLGPRPPNQRSSSTDSGAKGPDFIPTRTVAKTTVKAHNNPFQFVKVGTCPLYKRAEEQLQKTKEVKKQDVFREEEEEWQSNLDSWKSRRRKMSEDVFRRQEEIKQFELEEQTAQVPQKKTKTFSEMVESRAHRGRALSLCLISNPLEFQDWEFENKSNTNGSCSTFTDESEENSTVNSEDEGFSLRGRSGRPTHHDNQKNIRTNGDAHIEQNGSKLETQNGDFNNVQIKPKEGSYIDSGLESISSSHRAGDTPDSGSDFSQDSNSSIDCESPRTGVNIMEEFNSKTLQMSGEEVSAKLSLSHKTQGFGFQFQGGKDAGQVLITSVAKECSGVQIGDQIMRIEGSDVSSKTHAEIISLVQKGQEKGEISLLLWRHAKTTNGFNTEEKCVESLLKPNTKDNQESKSVSQQYEKSIESENEMYVDDFEELQRQSELLTSSKTSETTCTNSQAQSDGKISTALSSDNVKSAPVPKIIEPVSNGAVDKQNTNEKTDSEISTESPKKNIVKVKRVRRKGVYALDVSGAPNSIPQEGIPVGSLYPLSPVTELPSPADETKTISSTLSSKPTTPISNSQNSILPKETEVKVNFSAIKESNKTTASAPKSVISKTTVPSDESKINVSEKVESKIESSSVPSSPTVTKNKDISLESSVEEKPKLPSSPKKVKVKVKKANAPSEQKLPESPLSIKDTPVTQISDSSVKKLTSESQLKKEQKSDSVTNDKSVKVNKNENIEASPKMENNVSSTETAATKSDALSSSSNDKTPSIKAETSSKNSRNLSLKINTPNESANLATASPVISTKTPKTPVDEKSKPPLVPKKEKVKPKESSAGSTPVISEEKSISPKDKSAVTVNDASVEKTKNISLKTDTQNESLHITTTSPVTSSKLPKTPQEEKAKSPLTQMKEKTKSKEISTLPVESAVSTKEVKSTESTDKIPVTSADKNRKVALDNDTQNQTTNLSSIPSVQDIKIPKTSQDEKTKATLAQKKEKIPKENSSVPVESAINTKEVKSTELKDKSPVTSADKKKKPTLVDGTQNQATNLASKPSVQEVKMPKTPQEEKPKAPVAQKKEIAPKENSTLPVESAINTKEVKSIELKDKIPVTSADKNKKPTLDNDTQNQPTNLASTPSVQDVKKPKTPQDEKPKPPLVQKKEKVLKENNSPTTETIINVQEAKSNSLKEKTAATSNESSPNKIRNLSLNIQVQDPAINLATSSVPSNVKQPKTPQSDKSKPSFAQKKEKGKSKGKTPDRSPDSSQETKETFIISITTTSSPAVNFTQENPLIKELNSLSAETKVKCSKENAELSITMENGSWSEGNAIVIQETKGINSMNKTSTCSSGAPSTETKNLSLNIQAAQNQAVNVVTPPVVTAKPPKTPQDEKSKPSFSQKKGKSKAKGKVTDLPTTPTQTAQVSTASQSQPSSPKAAATENEHHKVQKSGSLTDVSPIKVLNENNKLLPGTPTISPEIESTDSKEKLNSDKTKNLSLQMDIQKESFTLDATSSDINIKEPKTPQEEKTKPRLVRRKSKKGKGGQCVSPASPVLEKEPSSNNLSCKPAETLTPESESHKRQNSGSITSDVQVPVLSERAKSSETRENNILPSGTSTETKSSASTEKSISSDKAKNLSLDDSQKGSVPLEGTPSVASSKQTKAPQEEKAKPRFVRKRSKSKGKNAEPMSPGSTVIDKETAGNPLPHTTGEINATRNEPHEQNSGLVTNNESVTLLNESTESSNARENNILLNGTPTAQPEPNDSKEKSAAPNKIRNLSLKIEAQNESVTLDTAPVAGNNTKPKTPQSEKAKPRLARRRSKSKGKNTEQLPAYPSQVDKNSLDNSASQTSAAETLVSSKEPQEEQKLVSVADDKPLKMVTDEKAELSDKREKNDLSTVAPTALPKAPSTSLKEENSGITSSVKTENLSLKINKLSEPAATDKKPAVVKPKQPKTPQDEKPKPHFVRRRERSKSRDKFLERYPSSDSFEVPKEADRSSPSMVTPAEKSVNKMQPKKKQNGASDTTVNKLNNTESSQTMDNSSNAETADVKSTASKDKMSVGNIAMDSDKTRNQTVKSKQPTNATVISPVVNAKTPQTDEKSKPPIVQKKENTKPKEKASLSLATSAVCANIDKTQSQKSPSAAVSSCNVVNANPSNQKYECLISSGASTVSDLMQSSMNIQENKSEPVTPKKTKTKSKKKNTNSQKVNSPAKQNEELTNLNIDSLNVIFQSESKNSLPENHSFNNKNSENNSNKKAATDLVPDIPPVEKVAEEMEKLILEQLEEEERAKELAAQTKNSVGSPEHLLTAPPRLAEPPKEKPPPPPSASEGSQKDSSLKRVNSTKRIKKEIHKRRSNFLGIDNADESIACSEPSIPPPPALEEILKAEMELDRQSRLKIESAAIERLTLEEKEIMKKEREIIESLECEERQKQLLNGTEDFKNVLPTTPSDVYEDDRILSLKNERKRIETERFITEEQQQLNLLEEKQLREREEFIRKQEAGKSAGSHSDSSLSVAANVPNNSKPAISSLTETKPKVSLSDTSGDGGNSSAGVSENKSSESDGKDKTSEKPAVPPKPLKKKEAIRKERERLRQEQEALQREREEHRRKLMLEQEELMKQQKSHAPDAPVSQLGPLPPLVSPNFPPQLTTTMNATPNARESASFPSRSHHGASNGTAGSINAVELMGPPSVRQNKLPASRKAAQNEAWGQQKMPSVRKQNHDSLTESRYNQNHWLIQEAEMRRISELKERQQRTSQLPCSQTHLAEDDVCSNSPRVPVITPTPNPHLNYAVQDKMWNYGQSSMPPKKYPPPVVKDPLHTVYPREAVSQQPPTKPSRVVPMERQEQMLSVSGRKRCSHCNEELGRGAAMIIESLQLYYHIHCFQCCVCQAQLGNGSCGTDVRVRNNKLHCHNCYSNDEAGLKFSQV